MKLFSRSFLLILPCLGLFFLLSCNKGEIIKTNKKPSSADLLRSVSGYQTMDPDFLLDYITKKADGIFVISTQTTIHQPFSYGRVQGYYKPNSAVGGQSFIINNRLSFYPDPLNNYDTLVLDNSIVNLFDQPVDVQCNYIMNGSPHQLSTSLQLPSLINIDAGSKFRNLQETIKTGDHLNWNADNKTADSYVFLSIGCDYGSLQNTNISNGRTGFQFLNKLIPDKGDYVFTAEDLKNFPPQAMLDINIYRGTVKTETDPVTNKAFMFSGFNNVMFSARNNP